jgi:phospholipase/carboxylesterase
MSSHIALTNPQAIDGIICLSGILLEPIENIAKATPKSYTQLKAFLAHGTTDPLLSIAKGRICSTALTEVGINVTHKEYPIKHQISQQEVQDLELWYHQNFIDN